jgi:hypothetical protein
MVHSERARQELAKVEPRQRVEGVQMIVGEHKSVTAKGIKRHLLRTPTAQCNLQVTLQSAAAEGLVLHELADSDAGRPACAAGG